MDRKNSENKEINLFVQKYLIGEMHEAARRLFETNTLMRQGLKAWFGEPDTAEVLKIKYKYATNI